jgi:hypothetical protein
MTYCLYLGREAAGYHMEGRVGSDRGLQRAAAGGSVGVGLRAAVRHKIEHHEKGAAQMHPKFWSGRMT